MATKTYNGVTLEVTKRQGWTLDTRTALYFDEVNKAMPGGVLIIQGSYNKTVDASAGTHDGPGALDLKPAAASQRTTAGYNLLQKIARERGGAAWFRAWKNNYHVHIIVIGTKGLPRIAANQVTSYLNGRDGLVSNLKISGVINTTFEAWRNAFNAIGAAVSTTAKVKLMQKAVRQTVDGNWGEQTDIDLRNTRAEALAKYTGAYFNKWNADQKKRMQKSWGAYQDGIWGTATAAWAKKTVIDIQRALGVTADGIWGPVTDKAYNDLRAKMYKAPAKPAAPKPAPVVPKPAPKPTLNTGTIAVNLSATIYRSNLKTGKKNGDVARYQAALWNKAAVSTRAAWAKKWGITNQKAVWDGVYGPATADLTKIHYAWLAKSRPGQGWTPNATEPGPSLVSYLGFKSVR
jgi:peptidoglycan hydrolase-like protein with peptidoglycan-binding domain